MVSEEPAFAASLVKGKWEIGAWYGPDELKDDFERVKGSEAEALLSAARKALSNASA
jgi:hypothetical protein